MALPGLRIRAFVFTTALISLGSLGSSAPAQDSALLEFVPADAVAVIAAYPREIAALPEMELFPREVISAVVVKEWSFDVLEVEKALWVAGPHNKRDPNSPGFMIFRFAKPAEAQKVLAAKRTNAKPDKLNNKDLYRTGDGVQLLILDDKTVAVGSEMSLTWLTGAKNPRGEFLEHLKKSPKRHLSAAINVEAMREPLTQALGQFPPPANDLAKGVPHARFAQAHLDLNASGQWQLSILANNEKDAAALKPILVKQLDFAAKIIKNQLPKVAASQDPVERAWGVYLGRAAQRLIELTTPKQTGADLTLSLKNDQTFTTALGLAASTWAPAVMAARQRAARAMDENHLKMILLAMHNYHDTYRRFPARATADDNGKALLSWRVHLLPFLEQQQLYDQFHLDEPWDSDHNKKLIEQIPDVYKSQGDQRADTTTRFQVILGDEALLGGKEAISFAHITDGTSNTIAVVQAVKEKAVPWTKPDDFSLNEKAPLEGISTEDAGGFLAAFADGSVRWIPHSIEAATLKALITRSGGEVIRFDF
jgi:hypothetical protein